MFVVPSNQEWSARRIRDNANIETETKQLVTSKTESGLLARRRIPGPQTFSGNDPDRCFAGLKTCDQSRRFVACAELNLGHRKANPVFSELPETDSQIHNSLRSPFPTRSSAYEESTNSVKETPRGNAIQRRFPTRGSRNQRNLGRRIRR